MNRLPQRRTSAIQNELEPDNSETKVTAEAVVAGKPDAIPVGWRLAIFVWVCGFVGLFLYEVGALVWKLVIRLF
jgi:hypothetical protein